MRKTGGSKRTRPTQSRKAFELVRQVGITLPGIEAVTRYDGSPVLKVRGLFVAGLARHATAEPDTLVVRCNLEEREWLLEDAPGTYYVMEYYRKYPVVLVRLSTIGRDALHDLLAISRRLALEKIRGSRRRDAARVF